MTKDVKSVYLNKLPFLLPKKSINLILTCRHLLPLVFNFVGKGAYSNFVEEGQIVSQV